MRIKLNKNNFKQFSAWQFHTYKLLSLFCGHIRNWPVCQVQLQLQRVASSWAVQTWLAAEASWACPSQQEAEKRKVVHSMNGIHCGNAPTFMSFICFWKFLRSLGPWESKFYNFEQWVLWGCQVADNHWGVV